MERKVTKLEHSHVEVLVTVDEANWKAAQEKAFKKLAANVTVDGFRKGKAPEHLVRGKVDPMKVLNDAVDAVLPELYREILEKDGIVPFAQPKVDVTKISDVELEVKFTFVVEPEVVLGQYKGLEVGKEPVLVTDEDIKTSINATLKDNSTLVVKEAEAEMGDTVVMDFVGEIDGVPFEGGSATNHELELGSHQFIPGFEEQLVGHKAGEKVKVNVTFPENYTEELKGKAAVFTCTIHEIKAVKLPELNDDFVKELKLEGVNTVEEFKNRKQIDVRAQKENEARNAYLNKLIAEIVKNATVDLPEEIVASQVATRKQELINRMQQSGLTLEQYLQIVGQKEEEFMAKLTEDVTRDTVSFLVVDKIAKVENVTVEEKDIDAEYEKIAEQYGMKVEEVKKALAQNLDQLRHNLQMQKVEEFLYNENK
ncbi:MAG: trigger factor [Bacilli bacterium]|nr:trigger factor [Bacilli bacterium]